MKRQIKKSKFLPLFFITVGMLFLTACTKESVSYDYDFVNITWTRDAEDDTEFIRFSDDGSFSYYCACGNPVNDSDLCEGYTYDADTDMITLEYLEKTKETISKIKLVECTEDALTLDFNGELRSFTPELEEDEENITPDSLTFQGNTYVLLEYNQDIFYYDRNADTYLEEEMIHELPHEKWDFIYYEGDLFVLDSMAEEANAYYKDDMNYTWSIEVDSEDMEEVSKYPLSISTEDLAAIYNFENEEKKDTLSFEDIEIFGTLKKTSLDGFIYGSTSLAFYEGVWYWRSEIIDESAEGWPEYVYKLPDTLNKQIASLMSQE